MNKEPLVFLPGALGATANAKPLIEELSRSYTVQGIDYPGHANSSYSGPISIEMLSEFLVEKISKLSKPLIFGYSMGGYIAIHATIEGKIQPGGIITYGTKFAWSEAIAEKETGHLDPEMIEKKVPGFAKYLGSTHKDWKRLCNQTAELMIALGKDPLIKDEHIGKYSFPLWVLRGSNDNMVGEKESKWASEISSRGSFEMVESWPHPLEKLPAIEMANLIRNCFDTIVGHN